MSNEYEERGRALKATKLVAALDAAYSHLSDQDRLAKVEEGALYSSWWDLLAKGAGVNPPSHRTQRLVIDIFKSRCQTT